MDDMLKEGLEGFDAVWQRVTGQCAEEEEPRQPAAPAGSGGIWSLEDTLLGLIHDETCSAVCAGSLARMFSADGRAVLQRLAAGSRRRLRRLRAEYFIATGVASGSNEDCRDTGGKLASLRAVYLQQQTLAERYAQASERTASPDLQDAFATFAAEARRGAQEARALLIDSF